MLPLAFFTMFWYLIQKLVTCVSRHTEGLNYIFWTNTIVRSPPPLHLKNSFANSFAEPHESCYLCLKMASIIGLKILEGVLREIKIIHLYIYNYAYSYSFHSGRYSLLLIKIFWVVHDTWRDSHNRISLSLMKGNYGIVTTLQTSISILI